MANYTNQQPGLDSPCPAWDAINPTLSDTVDDPGIAGVWARGLLVAAAGNVAFVTVNGNTVALTAVAANTIIPIAVRRVKSTGTTVANTSLYLLI